MLCGGNYLGDVNITPKTLLKRHWRFDEMYFSFLVTTTRIFDCRQHIESQKIEIINGVTKNLHKEILNEK